jgi:NAD(P)-dependent dehydrogenase (short-subunit alcohol dehydrogenase family)
MKEKPETGILTSTSSLFDLTGKVALVTGATGRLGREISFALSEMGAQVAVVARTTETLHALRDEIEGETGNPVIPLIADTRHTEAIDRLFAQLMDTVGQLDILVNNVTGNTRETVETMNEVTWNSTLEQIVSGMFLCSQAAGRIMVPQGSGSIINIASIYGMVAPDHRIYGDSGLNSSVVYGTGKAAVLQLTRQLAAHWGQTGIRVNAITPGGVEDSSNAHPEFRQNYEGRTPMQRMMYREEIRGPIVFLASQASSYVTGHNLVVDGGFTIL